MQKLKGSLIFNKTAPLILFLKRKITTDEKFTKELKINLAFENRIKTKISVKRNG